MEAKQHLVLSLFPGIGLLDMAFEEEGFTVVRGPDLLWGGDVRRFHPPAGRFDGVIGGPPCQRWSRLRHMVEAQGFALAENLIPEYERCVREAAPTWFLMENVPDAPLPTVPGYQVHAQIVDAHHDCGAEQGRVRRFSFGTRDSLELALDWWAPPVAALRAPAVLAAGSARPVPVKRGGSGKIKATHHDGRARGLTGGGFPRSRNSFEDLREMARLQGLPDDFDLPPFTAGAKARAIGNGVPLPMGRAVARAVRRALENAS